MAVHYDNKTDTWYASYSKRPSPKEQPVSRRLTGFKTEKEAKKAFPQVVASVTEHINKKISPYWPDVVAQYEESARLLGITEKTISNYKYVLVAYTYPLWSKTCVDKITTKEILEIIRVTLKEYSQSHQRNVLKAIRQVFKFAEEQNYVTRNPAPQIHFKKQEKLMGVLTRDQVARFLNSAREMNEFWYPHWAVALYTGMRSGELYALTWDKIDFENGLLTVDRAWNNKDGFKSTKSGNDRILEIAPDLMTVLKELKLKSDGSPFVLPRSAAWDKGSQAKHLKMFLVGMGLPAIRFHDLRATWATLLLTQGVEPIKVMKMGGWQDMKTMQIYIRKSAVDIKGCMNNFSLHSTDRTPTKILKFQGLCSLP